MKNNKLTIFAGVCVAGLGLAAQATVIQIGTGLDANGNLLGIGVQDNNWSVTGGVGPNNLSSVALVADYTAYPIVHGPWVPNTSNGQWITPIDNGTGQPSTQSPADFYYSRTINISGGTLSGEFTSDNPGALFVNGVQVAATPGWSDQANDHHDYQSLTPFNYFLSGASSYNIVFEVFNYPAGDGTPGDGNPTGLFVEGTVVPDGGLTASLLGTALIGLATLRRKLAA